MVYYFTSGNVKMLNSIITEHNNTEDISAYEFMKSYRKKCPEDTEEDKLSWISKSFLGVKKHEMFLKEISLIICDGLSNENREHCMILMYAVVFELKPREFNSLYKCILNLSKPLLNSFSKFLSNNEVLTFISQIAQNSYDTNFTTDKIIKPLFEWQPYISEMAHSYAEYVKKIEKRKMRPLTIPRQPNVLNRKVKKQSSVTALSPLPETPPNSLRIKNMKMLTKNAIDQKIKESHEKNKQKAEQLLQEVINQKTHYTKDKSENYYRKLSQIKEENNKLFVKPTIKPITLPHDKPTVKETITSVKRLNNRIQQNEAEEVHWLQQLLTSSADNAKYEQVKELERHEIENKRLLDIERKHLMGQISHEEAALARQKSIDENKKKYEEYLKEKETWNEQIEHWKKEQMEKNRQQVEKLSLIELNVIEAKNGVLSKNKKQADDMKNKIGLALSEAMKKQKKELNEKVMMIKEIKILSVIAKKANAHKIIDLTETAGFGLLCEMSIAELQEKLSVMKIGLQEDLEAKKRLIKEENESAKNELQEAKAYIQSYMIERESMRKHNKMKSLKPNAEPPKEICELKKILQEKRQLRLKLTTGGSV